MSTQNPTSSTLLSSGIALAAAGALAVTSYYMGKAAGSKSEKKLRQLYPKIEPYKTGFLTPEETNSVHSLYYEEVGNPEGKPVLFLHGGPGGGIADFYRQYFDPKVYRVILMDQRGTGKSTPFACLEDNTTWDLVEDCERLRRKCNVEKWVVFGGSWGACLSVAYAETHPSRVKALILRGTFTLRREELLWFYQEGASFLFPDAWEAYVKPIPENERGDMMAAYYKRLTGDDEKAKQECAVAWSTWEKSTSKLYTSPAEIEKARNAKKWSLAFARIECHYFVNEGFFDEGQLIRDASKLKGIPGVIVQGRYDVVCPAKTSWDLHKQWADSELIMCSNSGHTCKEPEIVHHLLEATDRFKHL